MSYTMEKPLYSGVYLARNQIVCSPRTQVRLRGSKARSQVPFSLFWDVNADFTTRKLLLEAIERYGTSVLQIAQ